MVNSMKNMLNFQSKREDMKILISDFEKQIPTIRANLVGAIKRGNINGWKE